MMSHSISFPTSVSRTSLRREIGRCPVSSHRLGSGRREFRRDLGNSQGDVGRSLQDVPADGLAVHGKGASQGEVTVYELVHPGTAALEVAAGALGDDALSLLLRQKGVRRPGFRIISRHGSRIRSIPR